MLFWKYHSLSSSLGLTGNHSEPPLDIDSFGFLFRQFFPQLDKLLFTFIHWVLLLPLNFIQLLSEKPVLIILALYCALKI